MMDSLISEVSTGRALLWAPALTVLVAAPACVLVARQPHWAFTVFWLLCVCGLVACGRVFGQACADPPRFRAVAMAGAMVLAVLLCAFAASDSVATRRRRYLLMRAYPSGLADGRGGWPGMIGAGVTTGAVVLVLTLVALVLPAGALGASQRWALSLTGLVVAGAGATVLFRLERCWARLYAHVGGGLVAVGACTLVLSVMPVGGERDAVRGDLAVIAGVLAVAALIWNWLFRVWRQQLDNQTPWTTAGRLCVMAHELVLADLVAALVVASAGLLGPLMLHPAAHRGDGAQLLWGVGAWGVLMLAAFRGRRRWRTRWFLVIAIGAACGLLLYTAACAWAMDIHRGAG